MSVLIIGEAEKAALRVAQERARAKPILFDIVRQAGEVGNFDATLTLADRERLGAEKVIRPQAECVEIPFGYRVNISYEEQPPGMCLHLSMSTSAPGKIPRPEAVAMVLDALDMPPKPWCSAPPWREEFTIDGKPGGIAVNIVILIAPTPEGHA
jgi:hypothetical protein